MPKILNINTGDKYGKLTINKEIYGNKKRVFQCKCDCGKIVEIQLTNLRSGHTKSCGCLNGKLGTHLMTNTKIYRVYKGIESRCKTHKDYYGRGIKCEWNSFEEFYKDMGESYQEGLTIDRINNDGNYCKENCRWVNMKIQSGNRRNNIIYEGKCLKHWCEELGVCVETIKSRIKNGWDLKEAIFTPIGKTGISIK